MHNERFFDQTLDMIMMGEALTALPMLAGKLYSAHAQADSWPETRATLHGHKLYELLQEDPFSAYSTARPRGYPGDAGLIDIIYDRAPPTEVSEIGRQLFDITIRFPTSEAVRLRRRHAETILGPAWQEGKRICVLACGHFREADTLAGMDLSNVTLVDQDPLSLEIVRKRHGATAQIFEANVFRYLRAAAARGDQFDLIYTLGLTDYLDVRAMAMLHRLVKACLAPGGTFLLANFLPGHLSVGWMDAIMDWHLIYRDEEELEGYAQTVGLKPITWRDATGAVVWCQMSDPA